MLTMNSCTYDAHANDIPSRMLTLYPKLHESDRLIDGVQADMWFHVVLYMQCTYNLSSGKLCGAIQALLANLFLVCKDCGCDLGSA